ncbi:MAG TPA: DUF3568 family protein [Planctomycetota bacterium]|nr:DUF3568 family protein [Planctomycetota bacterium]
MRNHLVSAAGTLAAVLAMAALSGCLVGTETMGTGDATRVWKGGKLSKDYRVGHERVWAAASGTIVDLKLSVESEQHDALVGRIKARRADDIVVRVDVDNAGEGRTRVVIWVGAIGTDRDKTCAIAVMDGIDRKLGLR